MSKAKKFIIGLGLVGAVGLTYLVSALKDMPEAFDWMDEDE